MSVASALEPEVRAQTTRKAQRILGLYDKRCTGCRSCELACAAAKSGTYDLSQSRIRVVSSSVNSFSPVTCLQCARPRCLEVCPTGAIVKNADTGIVSVREEKCVGCAMCALACPYGGMHYSSRDAKVTKCDFCDGDPECVKACATGALEDVNVVPLVDTLYDREDLVSPGLSACLGCNAELLVRFTLKTLGRNVVFASGPSCIAGTGFVGYGPTTGAKVPTYHSLLDNYASMITGTKRYYDQIGKEFHAVCFAGDGGTADVGFQSLSAAAERGENIIYICYDNEGYMNTGIQRSGTTPRGAWTTTTPVGAQRRGKPQHKKDVALIMAMHDIPYVATANAAYLDDYYAKLKRAMEIKDGLSYIHLFSPCPTGWRFPTDKTIEVSRMAVETNFFPLWEADHGKFKINREVPFPKPVEQYLRLVGKYSHLNRAEIDEIQRDLDRRYKRLVALTEM
ncbi:MAG: thiamine pyrophosphate-dependent enzyme [Chloroflexi bacterium]|nr:thiamine pyrophosphate-dependent enzyme [Chloroflexota bacterium]